MDTFIWQPWAFLSALAHQWIELMTGGAIILLYGMVERWLKRPTRPRTYVGLCVIVLFFACFLAWRKEYTKNIGSVEIQFYVAHADSTIDAAVQAQIIVLNASSHVIIIRSVGLGRIYLQNKNKYLNFPIAEHCREVDASSEHNEQIPGLERATFRFKDRALFRYMAIDKGEGDKFPLVVKPGEAQVVHATFHGEAINSAEFNAVALCPSVVYLRPSGEPAAMICEGPVRATVFREKPPLMIRPSTLRFKIFPTPESEHCRPVLP